MELHASRLRFSVPVKKVTGIRLASVAVECDIHATMITALNNTTVLRAGNLLRQNVEAENTSLRRLATGKRINSGKDDPAGLISSEQLSAEIKALEAASRTNRRQYANANVSEARLSEVSAMLGEMKALVAASANEGALSDDEIAANQMQIDSLAASIQRFGGDAADSLSGVGFSSDELAATEADLDAAMTESATLVSGALNDLSSGNLEDASNAIDAAITAVATARGRIGAFQKNTLDPAYRSSQSQIESLTASRSTIVDTDYAEESSNRVRASLLTKASIQTLKIAQQTQGTVLDLLAD